MPKYSGINHLAMVTGNMDATVLFWRDLLGMRLVAGLGKKGYRHYFFEISKTDLIAFFEWNEAEKIPVKDHGVPQKGPIAFDHLAIGVEKFDDLIELKQKLTAAGTWVSEIMDHGFILSIYSFDPNNIPIEFCYPVPDVDIRQNPQMKDKNPSDITKQGAEPVVGIWPVFDEKKADEMDFDIYPGEGIILKDIPK